MTEIYRQTEIGRPAGMVDSNIALQHSNIAPSHANLEASEMAAFEKGRMQGEMEAIRRMEAEQQQLKTFPANDAVLAQQNAALARPDVVEINRLTWLQRAAVVLGESTGLAYIVTLIVWGFEYNGGFGWSTSGDRGNVRMWNSHLLISSLGLFCLTQALLMYRILPLRMSAWANRIIYTFWQCAAVTCFIMALYGTVKSSPESRFWAAEHWCYAFALAVSVSHSLYSMARTWMEPLRAVDYETWSETNTKVTHHGMFDTPEQRRDHSTHGPAGRTVYAPAPHFGAIGRAANAAHNAAHNATHHNTVPNAPANAPRWTENPNTHAEDYFLLPRAKWAVVGYVAIGASILMTIAAVQHVLAAGRETWSQYGLRNELDQQNSESRLLSATGLIMLASIVFTAYAAMPPRTTLVKNGILVENNRRASISHNAETRLGHNVV